MLTALQTQLKMTFTCVFTSARPPHSRSLQFSPWGVGLEPVHRVLDPEMGEGVQPWEYTQGLPHPLSPKEMRGEYFHFRFLESPWALWHLESDPPPLPVP